MGTTLSGISLIRGRSRNRGIHYTSNSGFCTFLLQVSLPLCWGNSGSYGNLGYAHLGLWETRDTLQYTHQKWYLACHWTVRSLQVTVDALQLGQAVFSFVLDERVNLLSSLLIFPL